MDKIQKLQEEEYNFPYHHLVSISPFFQTRNLWWGYKYASYIEKVLQTLEDRTFSSVLDIGCGDGKLTHEIYKRFPLKHIVGIDYSEKTLQLARVFSPQLEFKKTTEDKFDAFTLVEVLEHIPVEEMEEFIKSLSDNLNEKGFGILTTPHKNVVLNPKHYQHFDKESIYSIFEKYFSIEVFEYTGAHNSVSKIVQRLLSNRYYILSYQPLVSYLYKLYKKHCLIATIDTATQVFVIVRKK